MFERALTIATVRGVDIRVHVSWLFIAALISWNFWARFTELYDYDTTPALIMAFACAVLFFVSILVHELAHALEAMHRGVEVGGITLFLFGGATESKFDVRRPRDEFALTAVGPFSSFVLAALFGLGSSTADGSGLDELAHVLGTLGWLNLALGLFNLLPGAPLDGGRILRSIVWWVTEDRRRAIRVASNTGRVLGLGLMGLGLAQALFVPGGFVGGFWLIFIGWFLRQSATAELAQAEIGDVLGDVPVRRLLPRSPTSVSADASVASAIEEFFGHLDVDRVVVRAPDSDEVVGLLTIDQVRRVQRPDRSQTPVRDVMTPTKDMPSIDADDDASQLLERLGPRDEVVVATERGRAVGVVAADDFMAAVRRRAELDDDGGRSRLTRTDGA